MDRESYKLLLRACREVEGSGFVPKSVGKRSASENAEEIREEVRNYLFTIKHHRGIGRTPTERLLSPLLGVYDVALVQACDLSRFTSFRMSASRRLIWPKANLPRTPSPNFVLYSLSSNLAHSLQAIRFLLLYGFCHQARSALRGVAELTDLMLVLLHQEDVYKDYATAHGDIEDQYRHWRAKLGPGEMRKRLERVDEKVGTSRFVGLVPRDFRRNTFQFLSTFSHIDYVSHAISSHTWEFPPSEDADPGEGTVTSVAFVGRAGEMERDTLRTALTYLTLFFVYLDEMLWTEHQWSRLRGNMHGAGPATAHMSCTCWWRTQPKAPCDVAEAGHGRGVPVPRNGPHVGGPAAPR